MKPILFYILQVVAASGLLYCYYHFVLRNKKFHRYNRFYLLMTLLVSSFIPFLNIPIYFSDETSSSSAFFKTLQVVSSPYVEVEGATAAKQVVSPSSGFLNWNDILFVLYFLVALVLALRVLFSFRKIKFIIKKYTVEQFDNINFVNTDEPGTPFSFFRWLFWNRKIELNSEKGEQIFRHELFHIQQKHSWDVIFMEIICTIFWINPFFHLIKKELKAIHEFLADEFAIKENNNWQYAELLLMQAFNTNNSLINPFFHNQIKRRIAMITLSKKPRYQYVRKVMMLPLAVLILSLFAFNYTEKNSGMRQNQNTLYTIEVFNDTIPKVDSARWFKYLPPPPVKKSPSEAELKSWQNAKIYAIWIDGKRINNTDLKKYQPGDFGSFYVSKLTRDAINYGKHENEVCLFTLRYYNENIAGPNTWLRLLITEASKTDTSKSSTRLLVLNHRPMPGLTIKALENLVPPEHISIITILKVKDAIDKYGDQAKNGAIEISTEYKVGDVTVKEVILEPGQEIVKPGDPDNKIFSKVEIEPAFPGGNNVWARFWQRNLDVKAIEKTGCPNGTYTVVVQFIVHHDGHISDVKALTNHGYGMEEQAIRLIAKGPNWLPGIQNGRNVTAYKKQPITFVIRAGTKNEPLSSNNFDPSAINVDDPEFKRKWREMILEIKAIAWKEGKAAYVYKGRTYVFGRITNPDPTIASFTEQNGTDHVFLLNDDLINSVDELNSLIKRSDVKKLGFIKPEEALKRFNRKDAIVFIETPDEIITKN